MSNTPHVSIGVPVYNGEKYIEEALDSALAQSFEDFEVVIVDNASTDRTPEICKRYAAWDQRVHYYRNEENLGQTANVNRAARLARGTYYRQLHDDDYLHPECIAACVDVLDHEPSVVLCHTDTKVIDEHGQPTDEGKPMDFHLRSSSPRERFEKYLAQCYPYPGLMNVVFGLIRRKVLLRTPLEKSYPHGDIVLYGELSLHGEFHVVSETLFMRRDHPDRSMRALADEEELAIWRDPSSANTAIMPRWRALIDLLAAVRRAPISSAEKLRCYRVVVQRYLGPFWKTIIRELGEKSFEFFRAYVPEKKHSVSVSASKSRD